MPSASQISMVRVLFYRLPTLLTRNPSVAFIVLLAANGVLHYQSWYAPPTSVHAWAQSDHYNLALGFLNNGFDFFHPQTYSLTHQFPARQDVSPPQGITAVDFPILHYVVALVMYLLSDSSPWVFRLISFVWSVTSLFVLFDTITKTQNVKVALLVTAFIIFQPIYCYYQNGFHVSSAAFNTFLVGLSLLVRYFEYNKNGLFVWAMVFMTLAALMRFTQIISLLAIFGMLLLVSVRDIRSLDKRILVVAIGISCVMGYFAYNQYLAVHYGSVFLREPNISNSLRNLDVLTLMIGGLYLKGFLPPVHFVTFTAILVFGWRNGRIQKRGFGEFSIYFAFLLLGAAMFTLLMAESVAFHDYYALDVWMPGIVVGLLLAVSRLSPETVNSRKAGWVGVTAAVCMFLVAVYTQQKNYHEERSSVIIDAFEQSRDFLNSRIPKNAKVLLISGGGWNTPMVGWQRDLYRIGWDFSARIPAELRNDYNFIVTRNASFQKEVLGSYPEFLSKVHQLADDGIVTIWRQQKQSVVRRSAPTGNR